MQIKTFRPMQHDGMIDIEVIAVDEAGATVTCSAQLTKDLSDIHAVSWDDKSVVTEALLAFVRGEVRAYVKENQAKLADSLK
jgi:hypothetical protein